MAHRNNQAPIPIAEKVCCEYSLEQVRGYKQGNDMWGWPADLLTSNASIIKPAQTADTVVRAKDLVTPKTRVISLCKVKPIRDMLG